MEFQLGNTYSGYEFLDVIKGTRNGIEFRVRNTRINRLEALRALAARVQDDPDQSSRFLREMHVHAGLLHPNIVTMFSAMELESQVVMTKELVEGPTLAEKMHSGPLGWPEAVALVRQVLSALSYAHEQKIIHRDICPENIVITPGGVLKVANFALAKSEASPKLTHVGLMVGNSRYISPEQVRGVSELDGRSDLYSAGMVFYEMLCGKPAFTCESQFELMAAQVVQSPVPPHQVKAAVPQELSGVVLKALAKDPEARYQTAAEFDAAVAGACERLTSGRGQTTPATESARAADPPALVFSAAASPDSLSNSNLWIGVAAGAGMGVLLVALWLVVK